MRVEQVDERDSRWEGHSPRFRVYLFSDPDPTNSFWTAATCDITQADVLEVIRWATSRTSPGQRYAVALVGDRSPGDGRPARRAHVADRQGCQRS